MVYRFKIPFVSVGTYQDGREVGVFIFMSSGSRCGRYE